MRIRISILVIIMLAMISSNGQAYMTRNGKITFTSRAPIENIQAVNNEVTSILDSKKGEFVFILLVKGFKFKKALMEEHFNENYMESNTYPKANFKGSITDMRVINFEKNGTYLVNIKGDLTIHGVTKNIETPATIVISGGKISATSKFKAHIKDYKINIPGTVVNNVSEVVEITVECTYDAYKKG